MLTLAMVYRSGGEFTEAYVANLAAELQCHVSLPCRIVCLTDKPHDIAPIEDVDDAIPLHHSWPGWWSKMELFQLPGPVLYFDLDTVIVGNIDGLVHAVESLPANTLMMLRGFYQNDECSGIMGWSGDQTVIWNDFLDRFKAHGAFRKQPYGWHLVCASGSWRGDQDYLRTCCKAHAIPVVLAQDLALGIYSFKVHVKPAGGLPAAARVVCFHGQPRPHEIRASWLPDFRSNV